MGMDTAKSGGGLTRIGQSGNTGSDNTGVGGDYPFVIFVLGGNEGAPPAHCTATLAGCETSVWRTFMMLLVDAGAEWLPVILIMRGCGLAG